MPKVAERGIRIEYDTDRVIRVRNKLHYRFNHWPIWIGVFFLVPGPLTFDLFARGLDWRMLLWLGCVVVGTGIFGILGRLPGCEEAPYIIRFTEDRPNPLYRRICYTFAWGAVISYAVLNITGLIMAVATGQWMFKQIYHFAYFPLTGTIWLLGLFGKLPRVLPSTKGEGHERRYFYGSVWAVSVAQPVVGLMWIALPLSQATNVLKLLVFIAILVLMGMLAYFGRLPRTAPIIPGQLAVSD